MADKKENTSKNDEVGVVPEHTELPDAPTDTNAKPIKLPMAKSVSKNSNKKLLYGAILVVVLAVAAVLLILLTHNEVSY